jgi:hypothetical protein
MLQFPDNIINDLPKLTVSRIGVGDNASMVSDELVDYVKPETSYAIHFDGFKPTDASCSAPVVSTDIIPIHTALAGRWCEEEEGGHQSANILGKNGRFLLEKGIQEIGICASETTVESLAFYDCHLLKIGEHISFDCDEPLPVFDMSIGENYVPNYLLQEAHGGGAYLEYHDRPHFHMPLNENASGYLIVGKKYKGRYLLTAFDIPFGYAVYMSPWVLHSDAFLIGKYRVIYSVTKQFSTVLFKTHEGKIAKVFIKS